MGKALIIDNDVNNAKNLSFFLKKIGFTVVKEPDPFTALKRIDNGSGEFDIIFVEQRLPSLSGTNILTRLYSSNCRSCVIFMAKKPDLSSVVSVLQEGAFSFLEKPIDYNQLEEVVRKGIENRKAFFQILEMSESLRNTNAILNTQRDKLKKEKVSLKKINQELNVLNQLSLEINSSLDAHAMVDKVARSKLHELIEYELITFFYLLDSEAFLKISAPSVSLSNETVENVKNESIKAYCNSTGKKLHFDNIHTEVVKVRNRRRANHKATLASAEKIYFPLEVATAVLGIVSIIGVKKMGENHLRLISTMTNHLALALKNATEHQKIQELAVTDELTGLYNRRAFQHALDKELRRSKRYQKSLSLIMLDIDGFKEINDTFGHQAGDEVLKTLAAYLRSGVRDTDLIARYGGDEFAIILPETKAHEAAVLAERLKNSISHHSVTIEETPHPITLSIGIADISNNGMSSDELIRRADHVLYRSKGDGGDAVKILSDT